VEVVICLLFVLYLLPFAVAARHEHERLGWILAANFLLGWTVVGWFAVLYWARRPMAPPAEPAVRLRRGHLRLVEPPGSRAETGRLADRREGESRRLPARGFNRPRA